MTLERWALVADHASHDPERIGPHLWSPAQHLPRLFPKKTYAERLVAEDGWNDISDQLGQTPHRPTTARV